MTIRFRIALAYGLAAAMLSLCLHALPAPAAEVALTDEMLGQLTGHAEIDDLPAYLTAGPLPETGAHDPAPSAWLADDPVPVSHAALTAPAAAGLAGLSWLHLAGLALIGAVLLAGAMRRGAGRGADR